MISLGHLCHVHIRKKNGVELSRAQMFINTHRRKDGTPINDAANNVIDQAQEVGSQLPEGFQSGPARGDVFSQVMGEDSHGRVRTMGPGVTPSRLWPPEHVLQERTENNQLRRQVVELQEQQRIMVEEQQNVKAEQQQIVDENERRLVEQAKITNEQNMRLNQLLGGLGALFANNEMVQTLLNNIQVPSPPPPVIGCLTGFELVDGDRCVGATYNYIFEL